MRSSEFITEEETYNLKKARIEHVEDAAFIGSAAITDSINALRQAIKQPQTVSLKPDGKPAIFWGRDKVGFAMGDKYMISTPPHSIQELEQILSARKGGTNQHLLALYSSLWPIFEKSIPTSFSGYLFGDLMYTAQPPKQGDKFVFTPNTVTYSVNVDTELGKLIGRSKVGIIVHSKLDAGATSGHHVTDTDLQSVVRNQVNGLLIMSDQLAPNVTITEPDELKKATQLVAKFGPSIDQLFNQSDLAEAKIKSFLTLLKTFVNQHVIYSKSLINLDQQFIKWLETQSGPATPRILEHIKKNQSAFSAVMTVFSLLTVAKFKIINELDKSTTDLHAGIGDETGQEGFIVHTNTGPVKLVDRFKFSAANLGKH